jgi:hypothetical protein
VETPIGLCFIFLRLLFSVEFILEHPINGAPSVAAVIDFRRDLLFMLKVLFILL